MSHGQLTTRDLPVQHRAAQIEPATFNPDLRSVDVVWTTGARRRAVDFWTGTAFDEELAVAPANVDMSRFTAGVVQVLDGHNAYGGVGAILGVATRGSISNGEGRATLRLSGDPAHAGVVGDIRDGIIRSISFGYSVAQYEITQPKDRSDGGTVPLYRAVAWTPMEISFVPIAADPNAQTRSARMQASGSPCEFVAVTRDATAAVSPLPGATKMTEAELLAAERQRVADISGLCARHALPAEQVAQYIAEGTPIDAVRTAVLDGVATRDAEQGNGQRNVTRSGYLFGHNQGEQSRALMEEALISRLGGPRSNTGNPYVNLRVVDLARERLEIGGIRTTGFSTSQLIERSMGVSDFPAVLANALNKTLQSRYLSFPGGLKRAARSTTIRDFRAKLSMRLGETPPLLKVNELGEYKFGGMLDARESYALATYGRIVSLSRQALINDDLSAFESLGLRFAQQAAEFEAGFLATLLTSNPTMAEDSTALFHANHGNLATGGGSALSLTSLSTARKSMRLQKGMDGTTPIDASPKYLIVPAALETTGEQLLTQLMATQFDNANPFAGKLELVCEPRLDSVSSTGWYLAADPQIVDGLEYAHLEGEPGPQVFTEVGFEIDGMSMKCRLDFGAGILDFRGLFKSAGA